MKKSVFLFEYLCYNDKKIFIIKNKKLRWEVIYMAKYILIRLINGTEYFINQKKQIMAKVDGMTGKKNNYEPTSDWTIQGVWFKKMFGGRDEMDILQFITDAEMGQVKYQDKKGNWKYGIHENHHGTNIYQEPLSDFGVSFVQFREE